MSLPVKVVLFCVAALALSQSVMLYKTFWLLLSFCFSCFLWSGATTAEEHTQSVLQHSSHIVLFLALIFFAMFSFSSTDCFRFSWTKFNWILFFLPNKWQHLIQHKCFNFLFSMLLLQQQKKSKAIIFNNCICNTLSKDVIVIECTVLSGTHWRKC